VFSPAAASSSSSSRQPKKSPIEAGEAEADEGDRNGGGEKRRAGIASYLMRQLSSVQVKASPCVGAWIGGSSPGGVSFLFSSSSSPPPKLVWARWSSRQWGEAAILRSMLLKVYREGVSGWGQIS
jgi:hypothetical protein